MKEHLTLRAIYSSLMHTTCDGKTNLNTNPYIRLTQCLVLMHIITHLSKPPQLKLNTTYILIASFPHLQTYNHHNEPVTCTLPHPSERHVSQEGLATQSAAIQSVHSAQRYRIADRGEVPGMQRDHVV